MRTEMRTFGLTATAVLTVFSVLSAVGAAGPDQEKPLPTEIAAVTVYEDRALVSRTGRANLPAGVSVVRMAGFPAALSEASLRAMVGGEGVKVISVSTRTEQRAQAVREKVRNAEKAVDALEREQLRLTARRVALDKQEGKLDEFAALARQAIAERATMGESDVDGFRAATTLLAERRQALDAKRRDIHTELESLQERLKDAQARLEKVSSAQAKTLRTVEVSLEAVEAGPAAVTVSYIVRNCGWSPRYDVRLVGGTLRVAYQGDVRQKTGEDWNEVRMALSTARPALGAMRPELPRLRMHTREVEKRAKRVRSRMEAKAAPEAAIIAGEPTVPRVAPPSAVAARAADTGVSVLFEVPGTADVPADGRSHRVPVVAFKDAEPKLGFETVPRLARTVYLRCDTANATEFPMLAGRADIWRESGFIGTGHIEFTPPGGKIPLSLGVDENLKVRRDKVTHKVTEGGLIATKKIITFAYDIEVANYHKTPQTVRVREHYPVSDVEEVSVELLGGTTPPKEHDEKDGFLLWEPRIAPGGKAKIRLEYRITMPKDFAWNP